MKLHTFAFSVLSALGTIAPVGALAADFTLKLSSPAPLNDKDALSAWMTSFEAGVEERSGGRVDVQIYPSSQLGPIPTTVEGVAMGTIEMTVPIIGFLTAVDPRFQVFDASGLFDDEHHALRTLSDPSVKEMLSEFGAKANVEPLVVLTSGQSVLVSKEAVNEAGDMAGKKVRTGGATALLNEPMSALGAAPVALPLGEVLPGVQTGAVDGAVINMPILVGFKFADVAKQATYLPGNFTIVSAIISKDFLATVGPELEAIIREEAEAAKQSYEALLDSGPTVLEGAWAAQGGNLVRMTDEKKAEFLEKVRGVVETVVASDAQMQADYDVLIKAAAANR